MRVDLALVPQVARVAPGRVLIVIDQIRASTTITTALDLGCGDLLLAGDVRTARRLARETGSLLAGERHARKPPGFDFDNSPSELSHAEIRGRGLVICTTNGTAVLRRLRAGDHVLVGCLRNARAVAAAAVVLARAAGRDGSIQVVCAGRLGRFVLEDAVAAGAIVGRISESLRDVGAEAVLTDAAAGGRTAPGRLPGPAHRHGGIERRRDAARDRAAAGHRVLRRGGCEPDRAGLADGRADAGRGADWLSARGRRVTEPVGLKAGNGLRQMQDPAVP